MLESERILDGYVMETKVTLSYGSFSLTLEGREAFVDAQLNRWAEKLPSVVEAAPVVRAPSGAAANGQDASPAGAADEPAKKPRKSMPKSGGPSCAARIRALVDENFFATSKKASEVGDRLKEKATPYEAKHIAAALISVVQSGKLRRVSEGGVWAYVNP